MLILKLCIHFLIFKEDAKVIRYFTIEGLLHTNGHQHF